MCEVIVVRCCAQYFIDFLTILDGCNMNVIRSFNPSLAPFMKQLPRFLYGSKLIVRSRECQEVIDRLDLRKKYPDSQNLDIIDVFTGYGLLSSMINYELKPRKHVVIEAGKANIEEWTKRINHLKETTNNKENFILYPHDGFNWATYNRLIDQDKIVTPRTVDRSKIHDELLIIGNLTSSSFGESLLAQWIMCSVYRNWLQKYGRVRMICVIPEGTAHKFLSGRGFPKRNRSAIKRQMFTDTKLIAITQILEVSSSPEGFKYDPNTLFNDQPYCISSKAILPPGTTLSVIEIEPKDLGLFDVDLLEYVLQILMYKATGRVIDSLAQIAPGAEVELAPKLSPELLEKCPRDLTTDEFMSIFEVVDNWAFKPSIADRIDIVQEDTRTF